MADTALVQSRVTAAMARRNMNQMAVIRQITETALSEVGSVHRYAVSTAQLTLMHAEYIQRSAGKSVADPAFEALTSSYLHQLTSITEHAGVDMLHIIDQALR